MNLPDEFGWSYISEHMDELAQAAPTWENLHPLFELKRQVYVRHMPLPEKGEWNYALWRELREKVVAFCKNILQHDNGPKHRANLLAIIEEQRMDLDAEDHPLTEQERELLRRIFGDTPPEDELDEGDWWKV